MEFYKVEFETDLEEMDSDQLAELVREFIEAQSVNQQTFGEVTEEVAEFQEFEAEIDDEIVESSPLTEDEVKQFDFSRKRDLLDNFDEEADDEAEEDAEFSDVGSPGKTETEDEADGGPPEVVERNFADMTGLEISD
jgi:hypothetical protein